jgi:hypothetical protein
MTKIKKLKTGWFFDHYPAAKESDWNPVFAFTIRPRGKWDERHKTIEDLARDYFNRVAELSGAHLLPITYIGDERTGNKTKHLHGTLFVEKGCDVSVAQLMAIALEHRAFKNDNLFRAIKPITNKDGWDAYKNGKHNPTFLEISCPRKRSACRNAGKKKRKHSCAIMRRLVASIEEI